MAVEDPMKSSELTVAIVLTSMASLTSFVVVIWLCLCCYKKKKEKDEYDKLEEVTSYKPIAQEDRSDVKKLNRHSWQDPSMKRSPFLTRKTIKFERPPGDKKFVTEQVQPDNYAQTSLNDRLGVRQQPTRNQNHSSSANASPNLASNHVSASPARLQGTGESSANSSPFHRVLHTTATEADAGSLGGGAAVCEDIPIHIEEPEYSSASVEKLGRIQFHLSYDFHEMTLTLKIIRAVELAAKDFSGTSDPYVKIMLLPDKKHKLQTNIKRRNLNPRWNEVFAFEGFPYSKLMNRTLYLQVLDYDRFSRDDPIGEICLPLTEVDLAQGQTLWRTLQPCKGHTGKLGELLLSLCYQPTVGRITVVIMKARELKAKDINGLSDPYVKVWLTHEGKKVEKKKTSIKEKNLNPVFNESFIFSVPYEKIRQTALQISVMDYDRMGRNELIGQVLLGAKSGPMEMKHWNEMFAKTRQPVAQWHILKDFG